MGEPNTPTIGFICLKVKTKKIYELGTEEHAGYGFRWIFGNT